MNLELKNEYAKELRTLVANELGPKFPPRYLDEGVLDFVEPLIQEIALLKAFLFSQGAPIHLDTTEQDRHSTSTDS